MHPRIHRRAGRPGFTLIELLTVIGIIVILMAILLPVMAAVRKSAMKADTTAEIQKIATCCQNYYHDYRAYPGPIPESIIYGAGGLPNANAATAPNIVTPGSPSPSNPPPNPQPVNITSSENVVLGLCGGMSYSGSPQGTYYHQALVGKGPQSLNPLNPQASPPYMEITKGELSDDGAGTYRSYTANNPSLGVPLKIPEFMDHYSTPHPIIYLRARVGAPSICDVPIGAGTGSQYYSLEMAPYYGVNGFSPPDPNNNNQVLYTTTIAFFQHPTIGGDGITPRSKDSFILISAGYDGLYETQDDVVYSN